MKYIKKDITTVEHGFIVHGVNCQGVQGAGVARAIKNKWPHTFFPYYSHCISNNKNGKVLLGNVVYVKINDQLFVAHVFSQEFYGRGRKGFADALAIIKGLNDVFYHADKKKLPIFSVKIGCGLGGLDWESQVEPIYKHFCKQYPNVEVFICEK